MDGWKITSVERPNVQKHNDLFFPSNEVGYSVGNTGAIMKTSNAGFNWKILEQYYSSESGINPNALTKARLKGFLIKTQSVIFFETQLVPTLRDKLCFKKCVYGSFNHYLIFIRKPSARLLAVHFIDELVGRHTKLASTNNGGENWEEVYFPFINIQSNRFILTPSV